MKKSNYIYIFLAILPFLDLITSITTRIGIPFSIGMLVKGILMLYFILYIFFKSKSKYQRVSSFYLILLFLYAFFYLAFKIKYLNINNLKVEIIYLIKFLFFPISLTGLINYFDDCNFDKEKMNKVMIISLISYIILIVGPTILNVNFNSYTNSNYYGSVGLFYAANEISTILLLLFPFIYCLLNKNIFFFIIFFLLSLYMISLIGTKVTLFGILIIILLIVLISFIKRSKIKKINQFLILLSFIITIVFMINNYSAKNLKNLIDSNSQIKVDDIEEELNQKYNNKISHTLLNNRDVFALNTLDIYKETFDPVYIFYGMGFSNNKKINNKSIEKLIEIDFLDIIFHMGFLALILILMPFMYLSYKLYKKIKYDNLKFNENIFFNIMLVLKTVGISSVAGHVYLSPAVSIYICLYFCYLFSDLHLFNKQIINFKKISILALHLGYGGIENVIANVANYLSEYSDVEIVSLYKNPNEPYKIANNVKINYLMNDVSNRNEFKIALKKKKMSIILKEGFKACKILLNKKRLMQNYIINSDAKVIISTRIEFSKMLNRYGFDNSVKIHQEHSYSVSRKYMKKLNKLNNFDYVIPISKALDKEYSKYLKIKVKYIPLALHEYPLMADMSNLDTKNIISIGRLEKVKGYDDLLKVMSVLKLKDSKINLILIGAGSQQEHLKTLAKELGIENNVIFRGYQNRSEINKALQNSSLYVMTSFEESFGLSLLEAMSYGLPCIVFSSAKGSLEMISKNNGYTIENRSIEDMSNKILKYFELNMRQKHEMGKNARKMSENYSDKKVKKIWKDFILNECLK